MDQHRRITTVVDDQVWTGAVWPHDRFFGAPPILREGFTLPGIDWSSDWAIERAATTDDHGSSSGVLGRENIAGDPANVGPQIGERFDQNSGLNGHVERTHDLGTRQRLGLAIASTQGHQARHFVFGQLDFLAAQRCQFLGFLSLAEGKQIECEDLEWDPSRVGGD